MCLKRYDNDDTTKANIVEVEGDRDLTVNDSNNIGKIEDLDGKVFPVESLVPIADIESEILKQASFNSPKYRRWCMWLVGRRVEVLKSNGSWAVGEVLSWNKRKSSHKIVYNDGETQDHVMSKMYYRVIKMDENANSLGIEPLIIGLTRDGKTEEVKECLGVGNNSNTIPVNASNEEGKTDVETEEIPWDEIYDVNIQNSFGNTALHIAASWARTDIATMLLEKGGDLNARNSVGGTPLHWAARYGKVISIELLAKAGADMSAVDNDGKTPADVAESLRVSEAVIANGGKITEKFYNVGDLVRIRDNVWIHADVHNNDNTDEGSKSFPTYGWPKGTSEKDIALLKSASDSGLKENATAPKYIVGTIMEIVPSTDSKDGKLVIDFAEDESMEMIGWNAAPWEVISVVKPSFLIGSDKLADAASWKAPLSIIDDAAEKSGYVESISCIFSRSPTYSKLKVNVFERIRDRQFALISTVSIPIDTTVLTPQLQMIKLPKSERPKIGKGQYLGLSCVRGHHLNIHSRSTKGYKTNIFYGDPPTRRGQISTFKSYLGSDKRGTTAAGWFATIVVDQDDDVDVQDKGAVGETVYANNLKKTASTSSKEKFRQGDRVMAMWKEGRQAKYTDFYPSTIMSVNKDGTYVVKYDDGYSDKAVKPKFIHAVEKADVEKNVVAKFKAARAEKLRRNQRKSSTNDGSSQSSSRRSSRSESADMLAKMKERVKSMRSRLENSGLRPPPAPGSGWEEMMRGESERPTGTPGSSTPFSSIRELRQKQTRPKKPQKPPEPPAAMVAQLTDMGFPEDQVKRALLAAGNDPNRAVEYCMNPDAMPSSAFSEMAQQVFGGGSDNNNEGTPSGMLQSRSSNNPTSQTTSASSFQSELGQMFGGLMSEMGNALGRSRGNSENETDEDKAGPPPTDEFTDSLKVGMFVDAKDSYGKWYEAAVKEVIPESPNGKRVFIHFFGWSDRFNEWIDVNSGRVQPSYSMIEPWRESLLSPGTMVECKIASGGENSGSREWNIAKVVDVNEDNEEIKIQSLMSNETNDPVLRAEEWISIESERLCKQGTHIVAISTDPDKLLNDPRALAQLLQNPSSLRGALSAMARETSGDSEHAGALSALQKQLGFLAKKIIRSGPQREPETVVDPTPLYWCCFNCTFERNLPSERYCRLCGMRGIVPRREMVEDLQVVVQNKDTGMWEEGRVSSSNEDGSITITFVNGINECVVKDPVGLTSKMGEDDTVVQVSSLAARQEDEEFEQDKAEQREERRQHSEGEVIRLKGTNILQDARAEKILYSRHSDTESFQRAKASELFIALPKEYKVGNTVENRGTLIQPFKIQTFMSNEHLYNAHFGSSLSKRDHYLRMKSTVDSNIHTYNPVYLIGQRVEFYWVLESQWFEGTISNYDPISNMHTVLYDDGEVKQYNLKKKTWRVLRTYALGDIVECWKSSKLMFVPGKIVKVDKKNGYYKVELFEKLNVKQRKSPKVSGKKGKKKDINNSKSTTNTTRKNGVSLRPGAFYLGTFAKTDVVNVLSNGGLNNSANYEIVGINNAPSNDMEVQDDIVNDDNNAVTTTAMNRLVSLAQFNSEDRANQQILSPVVHPLHLRFNLFVENEDNTKYIFNPMYEHVLQTLFAKIVSFIDSNDGLAIPNEQFQALAKVSVVFRRAFEASSATMNNTSKAKGGDKNSNKTGEIFSSSDVVIDEDGDENSSTRNLLEYEYIDFGIFKNILNLLRVEILSRALWTDLTCICNYKYDLEEFAEETEEAVEESKEKNIFDVNGVTKLQSDQTLSSVVAEWWETFGEPKGETYEADKVYTIFYKLGFVPNKFTTGKNNVVVTNILADTSGNTNSIMNSKITEGKKPNVVNYNNDINVNAKLVLLRKFKEVASGKSFGINWQNKSLTRRFLMSLNDKFCLASDSLPITLRTLLNVGYEKGAFLFPYDLRRHYFLATAFGVRRALYYIQREDNANVGLGGGSRPTSRGSPSPIRSSANRTEGRFRLSKLKKELVMMSREHIVSHATLFFGQHANRKAALEVRFLSEKRNRFRVT